MVECRICNREVAGSNLCLGYFAPRSTQSSTTLPGSGNEYQLRLGRQRQVWLIPIADERVGVQVKLWNPLRTRAIPERFCGGNSLRRGAISSVCTFSFTFLHYTIHTNIQTQDCMKRPKWNIKWSLYAFPQTLSGNAYRFYLMFQFTTFSPMKRTEVRVADPRHIITLMHPPNAWRWGCDFGSIDSSKVDVTTLLQSEAYVGAGLRTVRAGLVELRAE